MEGRRTGAGRNIKIFVLSLSAVLVIGIAVMLGYYVYEKTANEKDEYTIIDFAWLGQQSDKNTGYMTGDSTGNEMEQDEISDEILAEDERLYMEAVENGENVWLVKCADSDVVSFAFAGDILLDDNYAMMSKYRLRGSSINDTFSEELLEKMRNADVFMLNNEFPFSTRGEPTENKQFTFRANPSNVEIYEQMGVDIVSLANNHAYDYGENALLDTFDTLENANIPYVGAGRNIDEAKKPVYLIANGIKIAIVSATQIEKNSTPDTKEATASSAGVLRCIDETKLLEAINEAKNNSDFVILYIHWGTESVENTDWLQDKQAPIYAEAGVDLIIGDHPHCLQKLDVVSGVPVAYSLGNYWFNSKTQDSCLVEVGIGKEGMSYFKFVPCRQEDCRTRELSGDDKIQVLDYMRGLSPNVQIDDEGYVTFGE